MLKQKTNEQGIGKGLILWLVGVPIPVIILLYIFVL